MCNSYYEICNETWAKDPQIQKEWWAHENGLMNDFWFTTEGKCAFAKKKDSDVCILCENNTKAQAYQKALDYIARASLKHPGDVMSLALYEDEKQIGQKEYFKNGQKISYQMEEVQ